MTNGNMPFNIKIESNDVEAIKELSTRNYSIILDGKDNKWKDELLKDILDSKNCERFAVIYNITDLSKNYLLDMMKSDRRIKFGNYLSIFPISNFGSASRESQEFVLDNMVNSTRNEIVILIVDDLDEMLSKNELLKSKLDSFVVIRREKKEKKNSSSLKNFLDSLKNYNKFNDLVIFASNNLHPLLFDLIHLNGDKNLTKLLSISRDKWLVASSILKETNNIYLIKDILGEELYNSLVNLCTNVEYIDINDVINMNYDIMSVRNFRYESKLLTISCLSICNEDEIDIVRNFVYEMDQSLVSYFDRLWSRNSKSRHEILNYIDTRNLMSLKYILK